MKKKQKKRVRVRSDTTCSYVVGPLDDDYSFITNKIYELPHPPIFLLLATHQEFEKWDKNFTELGQTMSLGWPYAIFPFLFLPHSLPSS